MYINDIQINLEELTKLCEKTSTTLDDLNETEKKYFSMFINQYGIDNIVDIIKQYGFTLQDFIIYVFINKEISRIIFPYILDIETNLSANIRNWISSNPEKLEELKSKIMTSVDIMDNYKVNLCKIIDNFSIYNLDKFFKIMETSQEKIQSSASFSSLSWLYYFIYNERINHNLLRVRNLLAHNFFMFQYKSERYERIEVTKKTPEGEKVKKITKRTVTTLEELINEIWNDKFFITDEKNNTIFSSIESFISRILAPSILKNKDIDSSKVKYKFNAYLKSLKAHHNKKQLHEQK